MANIFQNLQIAAFRAGITPRTKQSRDWFRRKASQLSTSRLDLMKQEPLELRNRHGIGNMYMYFYDPKHKDTLPYYDRFPLTIVVEPAAGGFVGLNLHYLPMTIRAKFLDSLMETTNNNKYDESTRFQLTYRMLKQAGKFNPFKACFKHYLINNIKSRLALVPSPEWEIATFLPTASFEKASLGQVYGRSRNIISRGI